MDRVKLYEILYALAACDGREAALFGEGALLAREAFICSLAGTGFPELWFELPLAGKPWFDLHALASREHLNPNGPFAPENCGGCPDAFAWFAARGMGARQLALSWDVSSGELQSPAVQLLTGTRDPRVTCEFLESAGRGDAVPAYLSFLERLPEDWFACYAGVFPQRTTPFLRVECVLQNDIQQKYAQDASLLEAHLRRTGLTELGDTLLPYCQRMAQTPFRLEFQFDVAPDGRAQGTVGASVRFASPAAHLESWKPFAVEGEAGALMAQVQEWGLAEERWRLLADTLFAKRAKMADESVLLYCFPAFLKLRWRDGLPKDAKAYLMAGAQ